MLSLLLSAAQTDAVQATGAMCSMLSAALARLPGGVLQAKFAQATAALSSVVERSNEEVCEPGCCTLLRSHDSCLS